MNATRQRLWKQANPERASAGWRKYYERNREWLQSDEIKQRKRDQHVFRAYGLTPEQLQEMFDKATGCAVCGGPPNGPGKKFHIDHCHNSGRVRGLLCAKCNTLIGLADDNPETLEKAAAYLRT